MFRRTCGAVHEVESVHKKAVPGSACGDVHEGVMLHCDVWEKFINSSCSPLYKNIILMSV